MQRRRGQAVTIYKTKTVTDNRGTENIVPDFDVSPHKVLAWVVPDRSARAEVPGQQKINVVRLGTASDLGDVNMWTLVEYNGRKWDLTQPPAYHHGSRHVRHWTLTLRERP